MRKILSSVLIVFCIGNSIAQVASVGSGDWNNTATWDCGCVPDFNDATITLSHSITVTADVTIDETVVTTGGSLTINSGVTVTLNEDFVTPPLTIEAGRTLTVNGTLDGSGLIISPVSVDGSIINTGVISSPDPSVFFFNSNSNYTHSHTSGGDIPIATWDVTSTILVNGMNAVVPLPPNNLNQLFGNFTWNCTGQLANGTFNFGGQLTNVQGNLTFQSSNGQPIRFNSVGAAGYSLLVGQDFINLACPVILSQASTTATTVSVTRDYVQSGGSMVLKVTNTNNLRFEVGRNYSKTVGAFSGGTGTGTATLSFNGGSLQSYTVAGTVLASVNYEVINNSTLYLGSSSMTGSGSFTLASGCALGVGATDASGAIQTGATGGNIRVTGIRTYNTGSRIVYNGSGGQRIGNGFPGAADVDLEIDNLNGVINNNSGTTSVVGDLILTSGSFNIGAGNTLDIQSNFIVSSGSIGGTQTSNLIFSNFGSLGTLVLSTGAQELNNLTVDRVATLVLGSNLTVAGIIDLSAGSLDFSGRTLTVNGSSISSGGGTGLISSNTTSNLVFGGGSFSGSVPFIGSNQLNNLTFSTNGGLYSWASNVTVNGNLTLTAGALNHVSGLTMATNSTIFKGGGSIGGASPNAVTSYNVTYGGIGNTGVELPTLSTALNNLTVTSSGTVSLVTTGVTINGNALFTTGDFSAGTNTIFMNGPSWTTSGGSFSPGTGFVIVTGNTSIQGTATPQFHNLTTNSGSTLTARAGIMDISGNLQIDVGSTFNHNNGTLNFIDVGTPATHGIAGAGKNFYDITVNKTGGNLQITSTLNLINSLSVISATTVESNGNLVLISTSDGVSGNARIGPLLGGAAIAGDVTAQRFMSDEGRIYRYISSPVTNATVAQLQDDFFITGIFTGADVGCTGCTTNPSMYYYDEATAGTIQDGYFQFPLSANTETLAPGRGYVPFVRDDIIAGNVTIDLTGPINQGSVGLPVTYTASGDAGARGYNLVGNPFPSTIDWDFLSGWTRTFMTFDISIRDNGAGGVFKTWNGFAGDADFAGKIAIGQGFWVRANGAGTPVLVVNEEAKTTETGAFYRTSEDEVDVLEIFLTDGSITDKTYIHFWPKSSKTLDDYDAPKLDNGSFDMYTVSKEGIPMAINATDSISCDQPIKLGIKDMPNGSFTISRKALGVFEQYNIALHDKFTNSTTALDSETNYGFAISSDPLSKAEDRFTITLSITEPADVEFTDDILYSNYPAGNQWYRNGVAIEGATEPSYTPELSGEYSLIVTVGTCQSVAARTFQITGVEEEDLSRVRIYPNPAVDLVQVEVRSASPVSVELLDVMGRSMETIGVSEVSSGLWVGSTNMSSFKKGVYIVRVYDSINGLYHRRIIKE